MKMSEVFERAAAWAEGNPNYDVDLAIGKATDSHSLSTSLRARMYFRDAYGAWPGNDDGILMLCFAAAIARSEGN